jgi:integrase
MINTVALYRRNRMMEKRIRVWVQQFKDRPTLMLQWIDPDTGKRKSQSAKTGDPDLAEDARADLESDLNNGRHREASRMSWEKFRELFEAEHVAARRQNTRENYKAMFDGFERLCRPGSLRSVTGRTISQFAAALRRQPGRARDSEGQSPSTIRQRLALLRTALAWAVQQKLLPEMPHFPTIKVPRKKPQPIPAESFERMLAKAPDADMRGFLLAGWLGGLRLHEAAALQWQENDSAPWVDFTRDRIIFPAEFVKAAEDQWVPLDPVFRAALEELPRRGRKVFHFTSKRTHAPLTLDGIGERVRMLARRAGVKLTMHSLRKGFGCRYAGKVPAQVLQRLMRHANISLTMAFYANVDDAVMNAVLGEQRNTSRSSRSTTNVNDSNAATQPQEGQGA